MLKKQSKVPHHDQLFWPVVKAFRDLGGSTDKDQLVEKVSEIMTLSDEVVAIPHKDGPQSELSYRVGWVQSWLKWAKALDNPKRGVWVLTPYGRSATQQEIESLPALRRASLSSKAKNKVSEAEQVDEDVVEAEEETQWQNELLNTLKAMPADAFERLTRLLLLQLGFSHVEVVGRSGDDGIDILGQVQVNSVLSFRVLAQCKRFKNTVGAPDVRDFRGAMQGRTDKALFVTTGRFTADAKREATRDGVPAIDLIDGERLAVLLKEMGMGVKTEMVEKVSVVREFFDDV
ncbi:restriction endonuclease [Brucella pseudogrignonensis]|uniref:restriction endonuclease n=1 Tax=Brucella pseudogrignonensis TaxID=419475 RepID=UPI0028BA70AF|nr:restriction endonuclease [Brucella pseudogrignonensis]MDT6941885.1 restriction endonuclease [Brucella pseudogrignonensis]